MSPIEHVQVVIIGGGPVGTLLSALLSRNYDVSNVLLEKESAIPEDPRAFSLGEFGARILQSVGLHEKLKTEIGHTQPYLRFIGGRQKDLDHPPFLRMAVGSIGCSGLEKTLMFYQPAMERLLREAIGQSSAGSVRTECEVVHIEDSESDDCAYVTYKDVRSKARKTIKADFVVGTDGRRGFTRKMYLESRGVALERTDPYTSIFFGMNLDITAPTPESHPDFPLWQKGYSPSQVLNLFVPKDFIFMCNPDRQGIVSRAGPYSPNFVRCRVEFTTKPGEDPDQMAKEETCLEHVKSYFTHSKSKYSLNENVQFPLDCIKIRRTWHYKFEVRLCNEWRVGRVMIAGDAAHIFPPFGGQGVQAGFLDVNGLAWRLAAIARLDRTTPGLPFNKNARNSKVDNLLNSWVMERKSDISRVTKYTMENGARLLEADPVKVFIRDWSLWLLQMIPSIRRQVQRLPLDTPKYPGVSGVNKLAGYMAEHYGGQYWWQIYCRELIPKRDINGKGQAVEVTSEVRFTDDVIFNRGKKALFQLVVLVDDVLEVFKAKEELESISLPRDDAKDHSPVSNIISEATYVVLDMELAPGHGVDTNGKGIEAWSDAQTSRSIASIIKPATLSELLESSSNLFNNPSIEKVENFGLEYDPLIFKKQYSGIKFVVLRPDSFVFAAVRNMEDLQQGFAHLVNLL